jgi:hypothetical protein
MLNRVLFVSLSIANSDYVNVVCNIYTNSTGMYLGNFQGCKQEIQEMYSIFRVYLYYLPRFVVFYFCLHKLLLLF